MTYRYALGFLHVARFLFGGPLVALLPEPEPVENDPPFVMRLLAVALFIAFIVSGLIALLFVARRFGFDEIFH